MKDRDRNRFALRDKWLASEQRNRELTRQVEQLRAMVDAAEKLIDKWRAVQNPTGAPVYQVYGFCADDLEAALTTTPSSSDRGRNDSKGIEGAMGMEEK